MKNLLPALYATIAEKIGSHLSIPNAACIDMALFLMEIGRLPHSVERFSRELDADQTAILAVASLARASGMTRKGAARFAASVNINDVFDVNIGLQGPRVSAPVGSARLIVALPSGINKFLIDLAHNKERVG